MAAHAGLRSVRDHPDGVGDARILGDRNIVEVDGPVFVQDDVLHERSEVLRRVVDLRLAFRRELDGLRVTTAFKIEDAVVAPAVLVVADERAGGIRRERRFARAGEPEEHGRFPCRADVGRAVHWEDILLR